MQTFSNMRRSRFNYQPLVLLVLFVLALVYESIGTIYPPLTPLLGVGFYYWTQHFKESKKYFIQFLFFLYTLFFELDRHTILFSFMLLVLVYHFFIHKILTKALNCQVCQVIIKITYAYLGYYIINSFLAFLFNMTYPEFDTIYFIYIITDLFIVVLFI